MKQIFTHIILCCLLVTGCSQKQEPVKSFTITADENYPRWLKDTITYTDQTSGIAFIGRDDDNAKVFLLADDVGKIHHLKIKDDTLFSLSPVYFSEEVKEFLKPFPKLDFEEIVYDKKEGKIFLSIEGNRPRPEQTVGVFELTFKGNDFFSDSILSIQKLLFTPEETFLKYIGNNIGYEGLAIDDNYFYLGLEGFLSDNLFADSTIIFIAEKKSKKIIKKISTKEFGIHTVCGLFSDENYSIWGIDRNNKTLFHLQFDEKLDVISVFKKQIQTSIPGYPQLDYVAALESLTIDDDNNLYLVDDPWRTYYIPPGEILNQLDEKTINNFKKFIPIIYLYRLDSSGKH